MKRAATVLLLGALATAYQGCDDGADLASGPTSVFLTVRNGLGAMRPDQVVIEVHSGQGPGLLRVIPQAVPPSADDMLGNITIYAPAAAAALRFAVHGFAAGVPISAGGTTVVLQADQQVVATVILTPDGSGGGPDGSVGHLDAGVDMGIAGSGGAGGQGGGQGGQAGGGGGQGGQAGGGQGGTGGMAGQGGQAGGGQGGAGGSMLRSNGESCRFAGQCRSGFCIDGVCCNQACTGTCQTCAPQNMRAGICTAEPAGSACGQAECANGDRVLRTMVCTNLGMCVAQIEVCPARMCNAGNLTCQ